MTPFEACVLRAACAGELSTLRSLRAQITSSTVISRENTGVGEYLMFQVADSVARLPGNPTFVIGDVVAEVDGVQYGVDVLLWVRNGYVDELELTTFQEPWPQEINAYKVQYKSGEFRDLNALRSLVGWPPET